MMNYLPLKHPNSPTKIATVIKDFAFWLREYVNPWVLEANLPRHQDDTFRRIPHAIVTAAKNFDLALQNHPSKRKKMTKRIADITTCLDFIHEVLCDKVTLCANENPILITTINKSPTKAIDIYSNDSNLNLKRNDYVPLPTLKKKAKEFYHQLIQYQHNLNNCSTTSFEKTIFDWMGDHGIGTSPVQKDVHYPRGPIPPSNHQETPEHISSVLIILTCALTGVAYGCYDALLNNQDVPRRMAVGFNASLLISLPAIYLNHMRYESPQFVQNTLNFLRTSQHPEHWVEELYPRDRTRYTMHGDF